MRVALYYPWVYLRSGIERSMIEIKRRSRHDMSILTNHYDPDGTYPELRDMQVRELRRVSVERSYSAVGAAAMSILRTRLSPGEHDAILVCCDGLGPLLTLRNRAPAVNLCFTPLRAAYDEPYRERLMARPGAPGLVKTAAERAFRAIDKAAWKGFANTIAVADTVRRRITDNALYPDERIRIAHPGVAPPAALPDAEPEPMFLLPGRIMWTKNIELAIEAFGLFRRAAPPRLKSFRLVVAGMVDAKSKPYHAKLVEMAAAAGGVTFETAVSDARMRELYARCRAVLAPAFNEDFGLTPVEAMAYGRPVIASDRGGFRESVLDGETGLLVEPEPAAFAAAMRRLADDSALCARLGAAGPARAATFSWSGFVGAIDDALDEAVASSARGA